MAADVIWQAAVDLPNLPRSDAERTALGATAVHSMLDDATVLCQKRLREKFIRLTPAALNPSPLQRIYLADASILLEDRDIEDRVAWLARAGRIAAVWMLVVDFEELPERFLGLSTRSCLQHLAELDKASA